MLLSREGTTTIWTTERNDIVEADRSFLRLTLLSGDLCQSSTKLGN